jgi:hypothetical protein
MPTRVFVGNTAMKTLRYFLELGFLALSAAAPSSAQYTCTTNYCISSQSTSFQTPPEWPAVPIETCCRTHWGALPGGVDWSNGAPVMICTGRAEYRWNVRPVFQSPWASDELVGVRTQGAQARILRVHGRGELSKGREGLLRRAQQLQAQPALCGNGTIAPDSNKPLTAPEPRAIRHTARSRLRRATAGGCKCFRQR